MQFEMICQDVMSQEQIFLKKNALGQRFSVHYGHLLYIFETI